MRRAQGLQIFTRAGRYTPRYIGKPERLPYRQQPPVRFNFVHGGWIVV